MSAKVLTASLFALLIGVIAGLRTMTAPAAVSWAAQSGRLALGGTWLAFMGYAWTPGFWPACPPSSSAINSHRRRVAPSVQFGFRIVSGL
jgi:uncharacterized membrane protein